MEQVSKSFVTVISICIGIIKPSYIIFYILFMAYICDFITGILRANLNDEKITPKESFKGVKKKMLKTFYVAVAVFADVMISYHFGKEGLTPCTSGTIAFLVFDELISIVSNINGNGEFKIPKPINDFLERYRDET